MHHHSADGQSLTMSYHQPDLFGLDSLKEPYNPSFRHLMRINLVNVGPLAGKCVGGPVTYSLLECDHSIPQDTGERNATH